jgi:hypothetical protein
MVVDPCAQLGLGQLVDTEQLHTEVVPLAVVSKVEVVVVVVVVVTGEECNFDDSKRKPSHFPLLQSLPHFST